MLSKNSIKILKLLKLKEVRYKKEELSTSPTEAVNGSHCNFNELKELFEKLPYSSFISILIFLLDEKYIMTNDVDDSFKFKVELISRNDYQFLITSKGSAYLENLVYMKTSKYLPLILSAISVGIALTSLILTITR